MDKLVKGRKYTYKQVLGPAMEIETQEEADAFVEDRVAWSREHYQSEKETREALKRNLGYYAGYFDDETMERVNRLFNTTHPINNPASIDRLDT